jgi:hypothetical protein
MISLDDVSASDVFSDSFLPSFSYLERQINKRWDEISLSLSYDASNQVMLSPRWYLVREKSSNHISFFIRHMSVSACLLLSPNSQSKKTTTSARRPRACTCTTRDNNRKRRSMCQARGRHARALLNSVAVTIAFLSLYPLSIHPSLHRSHLTMIQLSFYILLSLPRSLTRSRRDTHWCRKSYAFSLFFSIQKANCS